MTVYDADATARGCTDGGDTAPDIASGKNVEIQSTTGQVLAVSTLRSGVADGLGDGGCSWPFTISSVPKASIYRFEAGDMTRQGLDESAQQLAADHYAIDLTVGEPTHPSATASANSPPTAIDSTDASATDSWCADLQSALLPVSGNDVPSSARRLAAAQISGPIANEAPASAEQSIGSAAAALLKIANGADPDDIVLNDEISGALDLCEG